MKESILLLLIAIIISGCCTKGSTVKKEVNVVKNIQKSSKCPTCKKDTPNDDCPDCSKAKSSEQKPLEKSSPEIPQTEKTEPISEEELTELFTKTSVDSTKTADKKVETKEITGILKAFLETKAYIEKYEASNSQQICKNITLQTISGVPTLTLELSDDFLQKTDNSDRIINNFKKYWEARALINAYSGKVDTLILDQSKDKKNKAEQQFQRIK